VDDAVTGLPLALGAPLAFATVAPAAPMFRRFVLWTSHVLTITLALVLWGLAAHNQVDLPTIVIASVAIAFCACSSHYQTTLLHKHERHNRTLAAERDALRERNARDAERVRALLAVTQHASAAQTVHELLREICETTVVLLRTPRAEIFLWDAERGGFHFGAAHGVSTPVFSEAELSIPATQLLVARLRAGEVVDFGASLPSASTFDRSVAAPMLQRGTFEGALFVGFDGEGGDAIEDLVQGVARQAALALANVRTMEQQQEDAEVSGMLLNVSRGLSACLEEKELWAMLARGASGVLDLSWCVACRLDERSGTFKLEGAYGVPDAVLDGTKGTAWRPEDNPRLEAAISSRALLVDEQGGSAPFGRGSDWPVAGWLAIPLVRDERVAGLLIAGRIGESRRFSRRQRRLAEGLGHHASIAVENARLVANLEAADHLKTEFVSTMSHELRTPLNVIIGYVEMLREEAAGPVTPAQRDLITRLDARGRELLELIEATLHVGRLEAGRDLVEIASVEFTELVQALKACTAGLPRSSGISFEWEVAGGEGDFIMTDRPKLALVVRNLVSNAFKFTAEGEVVVGVTSSDNALVIEVRDTGVGIAAEHLPIIFEMFRQVDGSMTRRHGGVGLGLYIVKQFATRLGGTVDVQSTPGVGTTFRVVLPGVVYDGRRNAA
jgi:signal transduction histidine kinase